MQVSKHGLIKYRKFFWLIEGGPLPHLISRHIHHDNDHSHEHVIFSGIQPTGIPHLGNYLGALQQWVKLQDTATPGTRLLFSIVDLHAITIPQESIRLKQWKRETLATLLAVGLDPERSTLFYQSSVRLYLASTGNVCSCSSTGSGTCRVNVDSKLHRFNGIFISYDSMEGWDFTFETFPTTWNLWAHNIVEQTSISARRIPIERKQ